MSRIGKQPVTIPNGVEVKFEGSALKFKKGNSAKELDLKNQVDVKIEDILVPAPPAMITVFIIPVSFMPCLRVHMIRA